MKSQTSDELLITALQRLRGSALAFAPVSRELPQTHCATEVDADNARSMIKRVAEAFLIEFEERSDVSIRNRVREVADGPLIARFIAAPVREGEGKLLGVLIGFREPHDAEFSEREARLALRCSRLLAAALSQSKSRDALTGLSLPAMFEKRVVSHASIVARRQAGALLYGNVDRLGLVNELWGLETGDRVIRRISKQLQAITATRNDAVLSRLTGDRFVVFLPECTVADAKQLADELCGAVAGIRIATAVEPISPRISWGIAMLSADRQAFAHSLAAAETACKAAKSLGGDRTEVHQDGELGSARRRDELMIVNQLRAALDAGRFEVLGQPINSLLRQEDERRYEMLLRILDEKDKLIAPAQFLPAATRYQLLPRLDRCVIGHVLARMREAASKPGFIPLHASFNLSAQTICDAEFAEWLFGQIQDSTIPGSWLTFELSETTALGSLPHTQRLMQRLADIGCRFALDNFGAGSSPLGSLRTLNFSSIKIDSSLVRDLLVDSRAETLIKAIAHLAATLGLEVVAEHVASPAICMRLIELRVQFGQGYAIGRPSSLEQIIGPTTAALARTG